ncbi:MAG: hypothetical protein KJ069_09230 [Anaerolineae bacterium]|nr:hypothetical protein [Anaerolineae bacterium]
MQQFVFWTGVYNLIVGSVFLIPGSTNIVGIEAPEVMLWLWLPAILVIYLGILLIFCSRRLAERASLVFWEGIARIAVFIPLAWFGFFTDLGFMVGVIGVIDLLIGLGYILGLPRALHVPARNLLFDR